MDAIIQLAVIVPSSNACKEMWLGQAGRAGRKLCSPSLQVARTGVASSLDLFKYVHKLDKHPL